MLFSTVALAAIAATASAAQFPVIDGVVGGVPADVLAAHDDSTSKLAIVEQDVTVQATGQLRYTQNSGVCETTNGVYQASGYGDIASNKHLFFWFFAARNNPATAPLSLWFNGGPGSSSMIGLFQELGPCRIKNDSSTVVLNPMSWNENSNVMFIDQPVGVGFSYGTTTVGTSQAAAADVWTFLQIFFKDSTFSKYASNPLAIWTESYGGHYGPEFSKYILDQNDKIAAGTVTGSKLNLQFLGVGDGLTDPLSQYPGYIEYAKNNPYHQLVSTSVINTANTSWSKSGGCRDQIQSCYSTGSTSTCSRAQSYCNNNILSPLAGPYDVYFVLARDPDPYPPDFENYIDSIADTIGAESTWQESNSQVYSNFAATGDWMHNSRLALERVINAGVKTLVYCGDADFILNYPGIEAMVQNLNTTLTSQIHAQKLQTYKVQGQDAGLFFNAGTFSYLRVYGAGHEVPAYTHGTLKYGQAALQMFDQIMAGNGLAST
ncbi:serine carboxypeptidase [Atractiella rhizophila]|nr:serine carboxypeptidase [Atractiella rhizophila]KAH8922650.1 serine carboxypeptidase [Atractiella rhizophila]